MRTGRAHAEGGPQGAEDQIIFGLEQDEKQGIFQRLEPGSFLAALLDVFGVGAPAFLLETGDEVPAQLIKFPAAHTGAVPKLTIGPD